MASSAPATPSRKRRLSPETIESLQTLDIIGVPLTPSPKKRQASASTSRRSDGMADSTPKRLTRSSSRLLSPKSHQASNATGPLSHEVPQKMGDGHTCGLVNETTHECLGDLPVQSCDDEPQSKAKEPPLPKEVQNEYNALSKHIGTVLLKNADLLCWFCIDLVCWNSAWKVLVIVPELALCPDLTMCKGEKLEVHLWEGTYKITTGPALPQVYDMKPSAGASLCCNKRRDFTVTLGGYIKGTTSGLVLAVTMGHCFYDTPEEAILNPLSDEYSRDVSSPAIAQVDARQDVLMELLTSSETSPEEREDAQTEFDAIKDLAEKTAAARGAYVFGTCTKAYWEVETQPDGTHSIKDVAFIEVVSERRGGSNSLSNPESFFGSSSRKTILEAAEGWDRIPVGICGTRTGFVRGTVSLNFQFWNRSFGPKKMMHMPSVQHRNGRGIMKGDSGAFVCNAGGHFVGMNTGGVEGKGSVAQTADTETFVASTFIPARDVLRWARQAYGEDFKVLDTW